MPEVWTKEDYKKRIFHPGFVYTWKNGLDGPAEKDQSKYTRQDYFNYKEYWKSRKIPILSGRNDTIDLFGNPVKLSFPEENIVAFDLKPYSSINFSGQKSIGIHKLIYPAYRRVFEKWASWGGYPLYGIGSSYSPRYALTDVTRPVYKARYDIARVKIEAWVKENKDRLSKVPGLETIDWDFLPCKLFFYENSQGTADVKSLSNHAFGLALDVNPRTNALSSRTWDMPKRLVELFMEEGFDWGGYYSEKQLDAMHFEYKLTTIPKALPVMFGPFSSGKGVSPADLYYENESGEGGLYPIGLNSNLHGGIHIKPAEEHSAVYATHPGFIVAARLLTKDMFDKDKLPYAFCSGHLGLVIIRHTGNRIDNKGVAEGNPLSWYSLYLHLLPPGYSITSQDKWNDVPWYRNLLLAKHGAAVVLDPDSDAYESNVWLAAPLDKATTDAKGWVFGREYDKKLQPPVSFKVSADGVRLSVPKPSPEDLIEAIDTLEKGALITFHQPFLKVQAGDAIGIVGGSDLLEDATGLAADIAKNATVKPGFLHWELLSPPGEDGLEGLLTSAAFDKTVLPIVEEKSSSQDNFFEVAEIKELFSGYIPEDERGRFEETLSKETYSRKLREFIQNKASFAHSTDNDLRKDDSPTQKSAKPQNSWPDLMKNSTSTNEPAKPAATWPLVIEFRNIHGLKAPQTGRSYTIDFEFITTDKNKNAKVLSEESWTVTDITFAEPVKLQVPTGANQLRIRSPFFHIEPVQLDDTTLQKDMSELFIGLTSRRLRGICLKHLNDWTVEGLEKLVEKLKEKNMIPSEIQSDALKPIAWYNRLQDENDPLSENPILGKEGKEISLFSKGAAGIPDELRKHLLPSDTPLINIHPVTGNWLLTLLHYQRKFEVTSQFDLWEPENSTKPWWWSIVTTPGKKNCMKTGLYVIAEGFPDSGSVTMKLQQGNRTMQYEAFFKGGIATKQLKTLLWGKWRFLVDGAPEKPAVDGYLTEVEYEKPTILGPIRWKREKSGAAVFRMFIPARCPESLQAFLNLNISEDNAPEHPSGFALLIQLQLNSALEYEVDETGDYIKIASSKSFSPYFRLKEIKNAAGESGTLSRALVWVLESLKEKWSILNPSNNALNLSYLSSDGKTGKLRFKNETIAEAFMITASDLISEGVTFERDKLTVTMTVTAAINRGGELVCVVNPVDGFKNIIQNDNVAKKEISTSFEVYVPNGENFAEYKANDSDWNTLAIFFDKDEKNITCGNEVIHSLSFKSQKLMPARFGDLHYCLKKGTRKEPVLLEIIQILHGKPTDWVKAKPVLTWEYGDDKKEVKPVSVNSGKISMSVSFNEEMLETPPKVTASTQKNPVKFDGIEITMASQITERELSPSLKFEVPIQTISHIKLQVWCDLIPPELFCKITVEKIGGTDEENAALTKILQYAAKGTGAFGRINGGICDAFLTKRGLKKGDQLFFKAIIVDSSSTEKDDVFGIHVFSHINFQLE